MLLDEKTIMPSGEVLEAVKAAIADYNSGRPAMLQDLQRRWVSTILPYGVIAIAVVIGILVSVERPVVLGFIIPLLAAIGWFIRHEAGRPMRDFRQSLRERMLPKIFAFAGPIKYANGISPQFMRRLPTPGLVRFKGAIYDDLIAGVYEGMDFTLCEMRLTTGDDNKTVFKGIIVYFNPAHAFPGRLFAAKRVEGLQGFLDDILADRSLTTMPVDRGDLDHLYVFRTDRPDDASPLLTGLIIPVLDYLAKDWPDGIPRLGLAGADAFLMVATEKDFFELPDMHRDINYEHHVLPMIRDLVSLLATARLVSKIVMPPQ
ncbi:hypothetical protein P6U16_20780 [Rhizobium sp. 32-5/1]|uniref:hypothetical protein n=1 Tax=Rhizobium sp. 32-5/1 TaxID=3019602 RepID=UPI00240E5534|nr:hypothetical protein [Rhizobium sp. 32-5/1]WEZ83249.1 hypothetical protein P6U16_20780 [Rhizobium sp. 32-5/1]